VLNACLMLSVSRLHGNQAKSSWNTQSIMGWLEAEVETLWKETHGASSQLRASEYLVGLVHKTTT